LPRRARAPACFRLRRAARLLAVASLALASAGCAATLARNALPEILADEAELAGMAGVRMWGDAAVQNLEALIKAEAPKLKARAAAEAGVGRPSVSNFLAISGGAEDGAFGAGLLVGWSGARTRPTFDLVTGVSAGALIAPFVFLGPRRDAQLKEIFTRYGREDILAVNLASGLFGGAALADSAPLARLIENYVDQRFLGEIAAEREKGRVLLIGTTNLDAQLPVLWDMGRIAKSGHPQALALFRKILLASASIPGAFPPVRFQVRAGDRAFEELHVDGGVTQQVSLAPAALAFGALDKAAGIQVKRRLYVVRNGKITPEWQSVDERALSIAQRSISTLTKYQGIGDLYRLHATAKRDGMDFNLAAIPASFTHASKEPFDREYMRALFELGFEQGHRGYAWMKAPPELADKPASSSNAR
jgi:predicted acylesterase/phospholipase RssA